ncbi:MAG: hypothetical protein Q4B84_00435 [Clostridia bacterium]|nr:hypothetical protein [Clostridia bacterium]
MKKIVTIIAITNTITKNFLYFWNTLIPDIFETSIANPHSAHSKHTSVIPKVIKIIEEV